MKYTPTEIAELLKERPHQPHYIEWLVRQAIKAKRDAWVRPEMADKIYCSHADAMLATRGEAMTDRELLELAAKAIGCWDFNFDCYAGPPNWNPLDNDGDALWLAVRLNIGVQSHAGRGDYSLADDGNIPPFVVLHNGDPHAATRRAIVRAAAEIGRAIT